MHKLSPSFFQREALDVAPDLLGKYIVRRYEDGSICRFRITEVEAYISEEDKACHASKGRTKRTEVMYHAGGKLYVYLIYGMYWMLNFTTGKENSPQAILIRGVDAIFGPGRVANLLKIDKSFYGEQMPSDRIWVESDSSPLPPYIATPRIGIDYAGEWKDKPFRFLVVNKM